MLITRAEQMTAFEQAAFRNFEDRMIAHLKEFAPKHFKVLEEAEIRRIIRDGVERARSHNLLSERSARFYIELMLMLGSSFDTDPQLPWAAEMLAAGGGVDENRRIDGLYAKAQDYVNHFIGDYLNKDGAVDPSRFVEQMRYIRRVSDEVLQPPDLPEFYNRAIAQLKQIFPRKCEYIGDLNLRRLVQRAINSAHAYAISSERGVVLFTAMMFVLGSGFDRDLQLPWVTEILNDGTMADPNVKVDRLYGGALDCLKRW